MTKVTIEGGEMVNPPSHINECFNRLQDALLQLGIVEMRAIKPGRVVCLNHGSDLLLEQSNQFTNLNDDSVGDDGV